jgi:hypothetical protein
MPFRHLWIDAAPESRASGGGGSSARRASLGHPWYIHGWIYGRLVGRFQGDRRAKRAKREKREKVGKEG